MIYSMSRSEARSRRRPSAAGSSAGSSRAGAKSTARPRSPTPKRIAWTPDRLWSALHSDDKRAPTTRGGSPPPLGCGLGSGLDPTDTAPANPRTRVSRSPTGNALTLRCNGRRKCARALHDTPPSTGPKRATHAESGIRHRADRPACDEYLLARLARERRRHLTADDSG